MLEKIKTFVKYVFFPISLLLAAFFYLINDRNKYKAQAEQKESEKAVTETLAKKDEAEKSAKENEEAWDVIRNRYTHGGPDQE